MKNANELRHFVEGSPRQPGDEVVVTDAVDLGIYAFAEEAEDRVSLIGERGHVVYLEYSCGCGQSYPDLPMIGVELAHGIVEEFWPEELS